MGEKLNAISLFSGIGGFELGIGDYCRTMLYCEADPHAQAVLLSRMSEGKIDIAPICTDIREITGEFIDIPIDIIMGGFPCQDISCAGKGIGLEGERSGLFFEIVRLAEEIKPTFLFLENVSAIRTRGLDRVIEELTEIGYDCRWCMLSASDVGAKHKRERWFLLANTTNCRCQMWENTGESTTIHFSTCKERSKQTNWTSGSGIYVDNTESERHQIGMQSRSTCSEGDDRWRKEDGKRPTESDLGRVVDGFPFNVVESQSYYLDAAYWQEEPEGVPRVTEEKEQRVERIKRLGNAVVPLQVKTAFEYLMNYQKPSEILLDNHFFQRFEYDNAFE